MWHSRRLAPDGKPLIQVEDVVAVGSSLTLTGSACAFEGNLRLLTHPGSARWPSHLTVGVGAPDRGTWTVTLEAVTFPVSVTISDEGGAEELDAGTAVALVVEAGGDVRYRTADMAARELPWDK